MSHQYYEGWFPECIVCRCGNVGPVVCLDPTCQESHGPRTVEANKKYIAGDLSADEQLVQEDNHWWKCCQICSRRIHADPGAFGSYAVCLKCFNRAVRNGELPVTSPQGNEGVEKFLKREI